MRETILDAIKNKDWETYAVIDRFRASLLLSRHLEFLTLFSTEKMEEFELFKVRGFNAGYALKPDGEIISVHNNTGYPNIGSTLVESAVQHGGHTLHHFDGFLTKFYDPLGFIETARTEWDDQFAPDNWSYEPIDISQFAYSGSNSPDAIARYSSGRPDIITRVHHSKLL